jgi:hypothetical protein
MFSVHIYARRLVRWRSAPSLSPGGPADPIRKNIRRKPMRQITEKAIAFVMALAISTGAFNVLIV